VNADSLLPQARRIKHFNGSYRLEMSQSTPRVKKVCNAAFARVNENCRIASGNWTWPECVECESNSAAVKLPDMEFCILVVAWGT
jgi:hypothetical protein